MNDVLSTDMVRQCRQTLAEHAHTFRLAGRLLHRQVLDNAAVLYAFCRFVDDTVDERRSDEAAAVELDTIVQELRGSRPARPLCGELLKVLRICDIDITVIHELIEGVAQDLNVVRIADRGELMRYAYRVAGTVGVMICGVLDIRERNALFHAVDLGIAMQCTNICRDVAQDARDNRVYLPATMLAAHGLSAGQILDGSVSASALEPVIAHLLWLADSYYDSARDGYCYIPSSARPAMIAAANMYRAIGIEIAQQGHDVMAGRSVVSGFGRMIGLARAIIETPAVRRGGSHQAFLHRDLVGFSGTNQDVVASKE